MKTVFKNRYLALLAILVVIYVVHFSFVSYLKYKYFIYDDFDLAVHSQALWNTLHGSTVSSILGKSFLGNHAHIILFFILPVLFLFQSPMTLLLLQTLFLGLGAIVVFLIAKLLLDDSWGLLLGCLYLIYPGLIYANLYEFHPTAFAVLFLLLVIYFHLRQRWLWMSIFTVFSLLCQENVSLILCAFFLYQAFKRNSPKRAMMIIFCFGSFLWFLFCVDVLMPFFAKEKIMYFKMFYPHLGNSPAEILGFLVIHPAKTLGILTSGNKLMYLYDVFGPLSFFSLGAGAYLFAIFPALLQHLLSLRTSEHTIYFHYVLEMIPFIFASAIFTLSRLNGFSWFKSKQQFIKTIMVIIAVFFYFNTGAAYYLFELGNYKYNYYRQKEKIINIIPRDCAVIATFCFQPKLSMRKELFSFHSVLLSRQPYSKKEFTLPADTRFALIDFTDRLTFYDFYVSGSEKRIQDFLSTQNFSIRDIEDSVVLFQKGLQSDRYLFKKLVNDEKPQVNLDIEVDDSIKLYGLDLKNENNADSISFDLFWKATRDVSNDIALFFDFVDNQGKTRARIFRPICYRVLPTYTWKKSLNLKEYRNIVFPPHLKSGKYTIKAGFYYYRTNLVLGVKSSKLSIDKYGRFNLMAVNIN